MTHPDVPRDPRRGEECDTIRKWIWTEDTQKIKWSTTDPSGVAPDWYAIAPANETFTNSENEAVTFLGDTKVEVYVAGEHDAWKSRDMWFEGQTERLIARQVNRGKFYTLKCGAFVLRLALLTGHITEDVFVRASRDTDEVVTLLCGATPKTTAIKVGDGSAGSTEKDRESWDGQRGSWGPAMLPGNIVTWVGSGREHIAVASGDGDKVFSLWYENKEHPTEVPVRDLISAIAGRPGTRTIEIMKPTYYNDGEPAPRPPNALTPSALTTAVLTTAALNTAALTTAALTTDVLTNQNT